MEKALAYVRVSTTEQAREGTSLDAQEDRIRAYCQMSGLSLVDVIREEGVTAAKPLAGRPGGQQITGAVAAERVRHVVALKLDRLFRDAVDALNQTRAWDRAGIALHLVDMGGQTLNTATAMGRMFLTMTAAFAELERNLIAERTQAALLYKKSKGLVYGAVPYGYSRYGDALKVIENGICYGAEDPGLACTRMVTPEDRRFSQWEEGPYETRSPVACKHSELYLAKPTLQEPALTERATEQSGLADFKIVLPLVVFRRVQR